VPVPDRSRAEGVVWLPEQSIVRAGTPGFFRSFAAAPGSTVAPGDLLAVSVDPQLDAQLRTQQARVDELEARYAADFVDDRAAAQIVREQLAHEQKTLARLLERARGLQVHAGAAGRFEVAQPADWPGSHVKKGAVIGWVMGDQAPVVRVVLDQATVDLVASSTREVELRLAGATERALPGRVLRQVPGGRDEVPSQALTAQGGGRLAADPRDPQGRRTLERVFEIDVAFEGDAPPVAYGQRVHVRFDHPPTPLAEQGWRALRRIFLRQFEL
jgi:putative peptide zinc metalloprotease protein